MTNRLEIPLPPRMQSMAKDKRGYPIPFIIQRDMRGCPHFAINSSAAVQRCLNENLCAICAQTLDDVRWLVGGPMSAFHENGAYIDTALHHECMQYALQVCPYLAAPVYSADITKRLDPKPFGSGMIFVNQTMLPNRPQLFVAVGTKSITRVPNPDHPDAQDLSVPDRPYTAVEFWQEGKQLDFKTGVRLSCEAMNLKLIEDDNRVDDDI